MALFGKIFRRTAKAIPVARPVQIPTAKKATNAGRGPFPIAHPVHIPTAEKVAKPRFVLGRASAPTGRRDNPGYAVPTTYLTQFLGGEEIGLTSSWLSSARYDVDAQELHVTFLDGARVRVLAVTSHEAQSFFESSSKGGWYHNVVLGPNYVRGNRASGWKMVVDE